MRILPLDLPSIEQIPLNLRQTQTLPHLVTMILIPTIKHSPWHIRHPEPLNNLLHIRVLSLQFIVKIIDFKVGGAFTCEMFELLDVGFVVVGFGELGETFHDFDEHFLFVARVVFFAAQVEDGLLGFEGRGVGGGGRAWGGGALGVGVRRVVRVRVGGGGVGGGAQGLGVEDGELAGGDGDQPRFHETLVEGRVFASRLVMGKRAKHYGILITTLFRLLETSLY